MINTLANTATHVIRAFSRRMSNIIAIEASYIGAVFGNMIRLITSAASFSLPVVTNTYLEFTEAYKAWYASINFDSITAKAVESCGSILDFSSPFEDNMAIRN